MRLIIATALIAMSATGLAGCGFTPVYGTGLAEGEGSIQINQVDGSYGHVLRRELVMRLRPGLPGIDSGRLEIEADENVQAFAQLREGNNIRTEIVLKTTYRLTTDKGVISGTAEGLSTFFTSNEPYDDVFARREASNRAAIDAAQKISTQLYLKVGQDDAFEQIQ